MGKLTQFYKAYFKEIGFAGLSLFFMICLTWSSLNSQTLDPPVAQASAIFIVVAICILSTAVLSIHAKNSDDIRRTRVFSRCNAVVVFGVLEAVYVISAKYFDADIFARNLFLAIFAICVGEWITAYHARRIYVAKLQKEDPQGYLRYLIENDFSLTAKQQFQLFDCADAKTLVMMYIKRRYLCAAAELKLFCQPYLMDIIGIYFQLYNLDEPAQHKMFTMPNANVLVRMYVKAKGSFELDTDVEMFNLPDAPELVEIYIEYHQLSDEGELRLFNLPNGRELFEKYIQKYEPGVLAKEEAIERDWLKSED